MTNIDKSAWGPGPWQDEPDRAEWRDPETGFPCLIVRSNATGGLCGYVGIPPGHPLYGQDYNDDGPLALNVHGGLTYSAPCEDHICHVPEPGEPDDVWWLGFDCGHYCDIMPVFDILVPRLLQTTGEREYRNLQYVRDQCALLAHQLKSSGENK